MHIDRLAVPITRLHLDPLNPRHNPINDEAAIIEQLCKQEKVFELARDIAERGAVSPLERTGVIPLTGLPNHYHVVEGNRRVCALKLLNDPQKAPTPKARALMSELAAKGHVPATLDVVEFTDRPESRQWIGLRHKGQQGGRGTRPWHSAQTTRFDADDNPNQLALAVLDRAEAGGWISADERRVIPFTTLTRYLSNPVVRAAVGLSDPRALHFIHEPSEVDRALRHFVRDALPRADGEPPILSSRSSKAAREGYAHNLQAQGISPRTPLPAPIAPPPPQQGKSSAKPRNAKHPADRKYAADGLVLQHADPTLRHLFAELRCIPTEEHEFAVNYLLRAFFERVMILYVGKVPATDDKLMALCVEKLTADGLPAGPLKTMRTAASSRDSTHSLHTLGSAVHGGHIPTKRQLHAVWDNWRAPLALMLDRMQWRPRPSCAPFALSSPSMPTTDSPLRYPGGKSQLAPFVKGVLHENELLCGAYAEPFAGGAGLAWRLLLGGQVGEVWINDIDPAIHAFWYAVLHHTEELCDLVEKTPINMRTWSAQRQVLLNPASTGLRLGFATLFLNRTNRSGILNGGVIGGKAQTGNYAIDCRFNRRELMQKIRRIALYKDVVHLTRLDAAMCLRRWTRELPPRTLINIDPPYFVRGQELYLNAYAPKDHAVLSRCIKKLTHPWMLTYDDAPQIAELYGGLPVYRNHLVYYAQVKRRATELLFTSPALRLPAEGRNVAALAA